MSIIGAYDSTWIYISMEVIVGCRNGDRIQPRWSLSIMIVMDCSLGSNGADCCLSLKAHSIMV
jgi:hypothetical protein